ncbi:peptidase M20 [Ruegeria meonggei]|uniref:p-aminobenzoyl-glutamate hydrolase subunit B n=1 Tax=Ruegeria meonggei TaxID=1446476 RepID=A0A1X7A1D9_9RHOB|nr:peptidase M20 [Ruegeria meonggei]SLN67455.1 p-aminobenzoyl-glutamate hydrolase subunit B [Ruegeria meonggei]
MLFSAAQHTSQSYVDQRMPELSDWCATIFDYGETAWREYRSAAWYVERLRAEGFTVEEGSGGMPTAFCAEWHNGAGPVVGMYAEYDGIPGNCQAAVPYQAPREGLNIHAGGHTDPHSGLGIGALGGLLATKAAMEKHGIKGGLRFTGEPAEKVRGSKPIHAAKGYYDGLAGMLSFHPFYMLPMCNTVRRDTHCGAAYSVIYRFICDQPEHWGARDGAPIPQAHSAVRAPGANDALNLMYTSSKSLRDSMLPHSGGWSISEAILTAGQATADNLPAALADINYMMRVPTIEMAEQVVKVLDRNARAAADMTGCRYERHWVAKSRPGLANHAMADLVWDVMQQVGAPAWSEEGLELGREVQRNLGFAPTPNPFIDALTRLQDPLEAEAILRQSLPPEQQNSTSDDYTDMCWHTPTARFYVARPALRAPAGAGLPAWAMNALGGMPETINPMVRTAAKICAASALRLLEDEDARTAAMAEFVKRTGGGIAGANWIPPLCDYEPPFNFRWPEYVTTPRGYDWWIPTKR